MELIKGSSAKFIELEQNNVVKRFVVPSMSGLEGRIQSLVQKHPSLILVRIGKAIVASENGTSEYRDGLEGVPSKVDSSYTVDLCGDHPVLGQGPARYSKELIQTLTEETPVNVATEEHIEKGQLTVHDFAEQDPLPNLPKADLAASFRAQMKQQEQEQTSVTLTETLSLQLEKKKESDIQEKLNAKLQQQKSLPEKSEIILTNSKDLEKAVENSSNKRAEIKVMEPRPMSKIDMLLEKVDYIERLLTGDLEGAVTGADLQEWFYHHIDTLGDDKTFEILASRLVR